MNTKIFRTAILLSTVIFAGGASAAVVNVDTSQNLGTAELLGPGTYTVTFASGAWNPYGMVAGEYTDRFALGFGPDYVNNFTQYEVVDGQGVNQTFQTEAASLAAYQAAEANGTLVQFINYISHGSVAPSPISFALSAPTLVGFFVRDSYYGDNYGDLALNVTSTVSAVPEASTWAMIILGFAGIGTMAYRCRKGAALAA